jgi:WD40 repeat protein
MSKRRGKTPESVLSAFSETCASYGGNTVKKRYIPILLLPLVLAALVHQGFAASLQPSKVLIGGSGPVKGLAFTKDGTRLVSGEGASLILWDVATKSILSARKEICPVLVGYQGKTILGEVSSVDFNHDGTIVASSCNNTGDVRLFDALMKNELKMLATRDGLTNCVMFSRDGELLASAGTSVHMWDTRSWNKIGDLEGHSGSVNSLSFSHSGKQVASGSSDRTVKVWDLSSRKVVQVLDGRSRAVSSIVFSKDDEVLVSGGNFPSILFWNARNGVMAKALPTLQHSMVKAVALDQSQRVMASAYENGAVDVWDFPSGTKRMTFSHGDSVSALVFAPDGKTLVSGGGDGKIKFWDISSLYPSQAAPPAGP